MFGSASDGTRDPRAPTARLLRALAVGAAAALVAVACAAGTGSAPPAPTGDRPPPPPPAGAVIPTPAPELVQRCESPLGFAVSFPEGWSTNPGDTVAACTRFAPWPVEPPEASDAGSAPISARIEPLPFTAFSSPVPDEQARAATAVDGRAALRVRITTSVGLYPRGTPITAYFVDVGDLSPSGGSGAGPATLRIDAIGLPSFDHERDVAVLDRMVRTLTIPTGGATAQPVAAPDALRRGHTGPAVLALQERLAALGYWLGSPDGSFGSSTEQAVFALQGAADLTRDGVVGPATRAALDAGTRPTARSDRGTVTEIDRDAGLISFARSGRVELVLHTSTGTFEEYRHEGRSLLADTPAGWFAVTWSHDGWRDGALGRLYRPRYFHPDGIAVHGYPRVPAYPASYGCARVSSAAMDMIWARDLMPLGSEVHVI